MRNKASWGDESDNLFFVVIRLVFRLLLFSPIGVAGTAKPVFSC